MPISEEILQKIRDNDVTLTSLNLRDNHIGPAEAQALANALQNNTTLTSLNLGANQIGPEELNAIEAIIQRNINMIPEISEVMSRIIFENSTEEFSSPQIRFISNKYHPENCVRIVENLVRHVPNDDIQDVLQRVQDMPGAIGSMILFTAFKAQESDLPQNKLKLPEDKLKLVKDALMEMELTSLFKAKGVTKEGVIGGLRDKSGNVKLKVNPENHILGYLERDDIKTPSPTVLNPSEKVNLVESTNNNPKGFRTIS